MDTYSQSMTPPEHEPPGGPGAAHHNTAGWRAEQAPEVGRDSIAEAVRAAQANEEAARWAREGDPSQRRAAAGQQPGQDKGGMHWVRASELFLRGGDIAATKVAGKVVDARARLVRQLGAGDQKGRDRAKARWQQLTQRRASRLGPPRPVDPEANRVAIRMSAGR